MAEARRPGKALIARSSPLPPFTKAIAVFMDHSQRKAAVDGRAKAAMIFGKRGGRPKRPLSERLFRRFAFKYYARSLLLDLQLAAKAETVAYIRQHMLDCLHFPSRYDLLRHALSEAPAQGSCLEFGVFEGKSINWIAGWRKGPVHGFDSFEGLPEAWSGTAELAGKFDTRGTLPKVESNVTLHPGWFDATLPTFLQENRELLAFAHIDCDLYSSTRTVLSLLKERIGAGSVLTFDEYFNYNNWRQHEFRAFQEFVKEAGIEYRYLAFTEYGGTVSLKILATGSANPGPKS